MTPNYLGDLLLIYYWLSQILRYINNNYKKHFFNSISKSYEILNNMSN